MKRSERLKQLEEFLRKNDAGSFIEVVQSEKNPDLRFMSLSAFYKEPELLYAALEYASYHGIDITIKPLIDEHLLADDGNDAGT